jgi:hypothetical protein
VTLFQAPLAWRRSVRSSSRAKDKQPAGVLLSVGAADYTGRRVRRINPWWPIGIGFGLVAASMLASALGWLGPLVACGADGAAVCVTWPPLVSLGVWMLFLASIVGLLVWQVATWRGSRGEGHST